MTTQEGDYTYAQIANRPTTWAWANLTGVPSLVNSVFGRSGAVTAQAGDYNTGSVPEGSNLYFTNARAQTAMAALYQAPIATGTTAQYFRGDLSLATFPTTWAWANLTGIPTLTNTVFGRSGTVTAQSGDYTSDQVTAPKAGLYCPYCPRQGSCRPDSRRPIRLSRDAQAG